jgi:hypothetical protein
MELVRGIQTNLNNGDFILVLRTDGRIVAMSDEVENHLGKTMVSESLNILQTEDIIFQRSLYTQCMNLYDCLDKADGDKLHFILQSSGDLAIDEHQLVCTFRLPKGKRPSRTREDIKVNHWSDLFSAVIVSVHVCVSRQLQWLAISIHVMTPVMIVYLLLVVKL